MAKRVLLSVAALVASFTLAAAQAPPAPAAANDNKAAEPAPPSITNAPPDKIEPANALKDRAEPKATEKPSETTGEATSQATTRPLTPGDNKLPSNDTPTPDIPRRQ
ncbi:MAG: hypothetical protein JOZ70_03385 [Pseudolabrys sp.]|nr:hypothetical protein [Pseudolabrys sp.]MBV9954273.1 hypothetical protein [Pseudolabrys sp.]